MFTFLFPFSQKIIVLSARDVGNRKEKLVRTQSAAYFSLSIRSPRRSEWNIYRRAQNTLKLSSFRRKRQITLTSHVDVSGAAHVSPRQNDEIEDVANDTEAANNRHHDTITDPSQSRRARILHVFRQQADIPNGGTYIEHVHHLAVFSLQRLSQLAISLPVPPCTRAHLRTLSFGHRALILQISRGRTIALPPRGFFVTSWPGDVSRDFGIAIPNSEVIRVRLN